MKHLTSRDNPFYKNLHKLATQRRARGAAGQTLLDGSHLLAALLDSGCQPAHVLLKADALENAEVVALLQRLDGVPVTMLTDALFAGLTELKSHSGVLALVDIVAPTAEPGRFVLLLDAVQDPGNLGTMLRSAAAAGCDAAYLSSGCADAWSPKVLRAGMGAHFALAIHAETDLPAFARVAAFPIYAAALSAPRSLYDCDLRGPLGFAIGNEGAGLSADLAACCQPVSIPMPGRMESLNAAAAGAICLFEAVRQRRA